MRAFVEAEVEEELVGLADRWAGLDAQSGHDLFAVEIGTNRSQLFLGGEVGDAPLEVVVGEFQPLGLATIPGSAVSCLLYTSDAADE